MSHQVSRGSEGTEPVGRNLLPHRFILSRWAKKSRVWALSARTAREVTVDSLRLHVFMWMSVHKALRPVSAWENTIGTVSGERGWVCVRRVRLRTGLRLCLVMYGAVAQTDIMLSELAAWLVLSDWLLSSAVECPLFPTEPAPSLRRDAVELPLSAQKTNEPN